MTVIDATNSNIALEWGVYMNIEYKRHRISKVTCHETDPIMFMGIR